MANRNSKLAIAIICLITTVAIGYIVIVDSPGRRFGRAYGQLELGMSKNKVRALFSAEPEFECRLRSSDIWYIRAPDDLAGNFENVDIQSGSNVNSTSELPDVYDHVQLAFDSEDRLHAFTWIGETYTVESTTGSTRGSHFNLLPDSNF